MIKALNIFYAVLALVFAGTPAVSMAVDPIVLTDSAFATATIVNVDKKTREITLRDEKGAEVVVVAGPEVRNFAQIKKGDILEVEYHRAAASTLQKVGDTNMGGHSTDVERAPAGSKPGMVAMQRSTIAATVLDVDTVNRLLTVQGPKGNIVVIKVPADVKAFDSLQKGDKISAEYAEAVAVSVRTPAKKK